MDSDDNTWRLFDAFQQPEASPSIHENVNNGSDAIIEPLDERCGFCNSLDVAIVDGNYVCLQCGTVVDRIIDTGAEWRYYGYDDNKNGDPSRCGLPTNDLLPQSSLGTIIGNKMGECYEMKMLRKYQIWNSMCYKERTLYNIFDMLTVNCVNSGIPPSILEEAKALYKKISEAKLSRGENRSGLIASSIYMSCKANNVPRSAKEIAKIFNLKPTTMTKGCKKCQELLQMEVKSTTPKDFILRFCSKLNLDKDIKELCLHVVDTADNLSIVCENTPPSISAGCIYLVCCICQVSIDKKELASACGVSIVTIIKCYKRLYTYRMHVVPEWVLKKYDVK